MPELRISLRGLLLLGCWIALSPLEIRAQPSNRYVLDSLAASCFVSLPDTLEALQLEGDPEHAYLQPALVATLQKRGIHIWLNRTPSTPLPQLRYHMVEQDIQYTPASRGYLQRSIRIALEYQLIHPEGYTLKHELCSRQYNDIIERNARTRIEDPLLPQTQGKGPLSRWQRYIQPVLWLGATVITVYLFFTLRSQRK